MCVCVYLKIIKKKKINKPDVLCDRRNHVRTCPWGYNQLGFISICQGPKSLV